MIIETYRYTHGLYIVNNSLLDLDAGATRGHKYKLKKERKKDEMLHKPASGC